MGEYRIVPVKDGEGVYYNIENKSGFSNWSFVTFTYSIEAAKQKIDAIVKYDKLHEDFSKNNPIIYYP